MAAVETECWYDDNGQLNRDGDLPAVMYANGDQEWYLHHLRHRDGGRPAIVYTDGYLAWYVNGGKTGNNRDMGPPPNAVLDNSGTGLLTKSAAKG